MGLLARNDARRAVQHRELVDRVFAAVAAEFPYYPLTSEVIEAAVGATLEAIRQPTENMADAGERGMSTTPAGVWIRMIDALKREMLRCPSGIKP